MQPDLTPKQQTSEAVRQAESILVTTGQNPTIDQITAVLALAAILRKFGKKVSAIISDPLPTQVGFLDTSAISQSLSGLRDFIVRVDMKRSEVDKLRWEVVEGKLNVIVTPFQGGFAPSDVTFDYGDYKFDLAIVLGVPSRNRMDRVLLNNQSLLESMPLLNLDFHRSNESYGAVNLIEPTASSLCEILVALSESLQTGLIDADIATTMLTGLMSSTDRFTAGHTTSKSMTVGAQLMAAGARQPAVVRGLYQVGNSTNRPSRDDRAPRDDRPRRDQQPERAPRDDRAPREDRPARDDRPRREEREPVRRDDAQAPAPRPEPIARPDQPQPTPAPTEASVTTVNVVSDPHADVASVPMPASEPIINPGHIEMMPVDHAPVSDQLAMDVPAMADFAAAAEFLRQPSTDDSTEPSAEPTPNETHESN